MGTIGYTVICYYRAILLIFSYEEWDVISSAEKKSKKEHEELFWMEC
jgi:hypothetical protein